MEPHFRGSVAAVIVLGYLSIIRLGRESERYESSASVFYKGAVYMFMMNMI